MINFFKIILYQPLLYLLILFYRYLPGHDFGVAVIVLTILIRILLYPLGVQTIKSQKALSEIQPKIKEIQEKYKNDKERQTKEMLGLYKREKINPFSGILPILIQLPILIALFWVFRNFAQGFNPGELNTKFLGLVDLAQPSWVFAALAGILQFFQTKMVTPKNNRDKKQTSNFSDQLQKQMQYFFPIFTILILLRLPSAIGLYWLTTTIFTIFQQYIMLKKQKI